MYQIVLEVTSRKFRSTINPDSEPFEMNAMKTNSTTIKVTLLTLSYIFLFSLKGFSQPDYDFTNGAHISGTDLQIGAVYRYSDVKPGVDAIVTVMDISSGVVLIEIDAGSGYPEALQPTINVDPMTNGFVELKIDFVIAGTFTLLNQLEIPVTCIDVDGVSGSVYEFDQITWGASAYMNYDLIGNELTINTSPGWKSCKNALGVDYPGRDTSARQVMFTVVNANLSSINIRVGADVVHPTNSAYRLRSIYFKKFTYNNSFLSSADLISFAGNKNINNEIVLSSTLRADHSLQNVAIEKSGNGSSFSVIGVLDVTGKTSVQYTDINKNNMGGYYRLRLNSRNGNVGYSSVLYIKSVETTNKMTVYPSIVTNHTNISFTSSKANIAKISVYDQSGKILMKKDISAQAGTTIFSLNGLSQFSAGHYYVVLTSEGKNYTQKIQRTN